MTRSPTTRVSTTDPLLPGLRSLLEPERLSGPLAAAGVDGVGFPKARVGYVRYRTGRSVVAALLHPDDERNTPLGYGVCLHAQVFEEVAAKLERRREKRPDAAAAIVLPDLQTLLFPFPYDRRLPGLAEAWAGAAIAGLPERAPESATLLRYKPEHRVVLRVEDACPDGRAAFLRIQRNEQSLREAALLSGLAEALGKQSALRVPEVIGVERELLAMSVGEVRGEKLLSGPRADGPGRFERTGAAIARLHETPPPKQERGVGEALGGALEHLSDLARFEAASVLERLLEDTAPDPVAGSLAFAHGDLHAGQVLVAPDAIALIDFERAHAGPVESDPGSLLAHLEYVRIKGGVLDADGLGNAFLAGYRAAGGKLASASVDWWTAVALVGIAAKPQRRLRNDARAPAARTLERAYELLTRPPRP